MSTPVATPTLPAALRLGAVELTVGDLGRSVAFYEGSLGLQVHRREGVRAAMGAGGEDLLRLAEEPGARPAGRHAGLFHLALLYPGRTELAGALARLVAARTPLSGAADHGVSEALYLADPDGNGLELYADRPREQWPAPAAPGERVGMFTAPLDVRDLLQAAGDNAPPAAPPRLIMGHVHLHVGDIAQGLGFYRDVLGFELMQEFGGTAAFVSAGGYHHHLAFNVWRGQGVGPAPAGTVGLREWTVVLETAQQVDAVRARATAADAIVEDDPGGGLLARDPWDISARFVSDRG
ncbi:MAG TPA: VOC family protein [Solirubrobacteraceae bacterium]|nr:VOC family protein [Solirubrobacteraceae bacterium]